MPDTPILDTTPVLDTLARLSDAWNAGDATAYGAEFTRDASYVAFNGQVMLGRTVIEDTHRWLFDGPLRGSRMTTTSDDALPAAVRFLRPDVAHVLTIGAVLPAGQSTVTADRESVVSFVVTDEGDTWRVAAFHNTRRLDPATAAGR
ncbi:MAG: SgcJ/EcaC family oxidoreductase [Pseudonocardia sp.]